MSLYAKRSLSYCAAARCNNECRVRARHVAVLRFHSFGTRPHQWPNDRYEAGDAPLDVPVAIGRGTGVVIRSDHNARAPCAAVQSNHIRCTRRIELTSVHSTEGVHSESHSFAGPRVANSVDTIRVRRVVCRHFRNADTDHDVEPTVLQVPAQADGFLDGPHY